MEDGHANLPIIDCHVNTSQRNEDLLNVQEEPQAAVEEVVEEEQPAINEGNLDEVPGLMEEEAIADDEQQEDGVEQQQLDQNETHKERQEQIIVEALNLPVEATGIANHPPKRNGEGLVKLNGKKQFTQEARAVACLFATYAMGWHQEMPKRQKKRIAAVACAIVSYDYGYRNVLGKFWLEKWLNRVENSILHSSSTAITTNNHKGKTSYTDNITQQHPTYLHELFRAATNLLGDDATFARLTQQMNLQSEANENLPTLRLTKLQVFRWFKKIRGRRNKQERSRY